MLGGARARVGDVRADFLTRVGSADDALIQVADERSAELIVVGTREPGFLGAAARGQRQPGRGQAAHCDVLVVRPKHKG